MEPEDRITAEDEPVAESVRPEEDRRRDDRHSWVYFPVLMVFVILIVLMLLPRGFFDTLPAGPNQQPTGPSVKVPDVVGLTLAEATPRASALDLRLVPGSAPTAAPDLIIVVAQSPSGGSSLPRNGTLRVTIQEPPPPAPAEDVATFTAPGGSSGHSAQVRVPSYVVVPDVSGMARAAAASAARSAGLVPYAIFRPRSTSSERGHVFQQWPAAGTRIARGSELLIAVGMGK